MDIPREVVGLNIGLFETEDSYNLYIACCDKFDVEDSDWACSECFEHPLRYLELPALKTAYPNWNNFQTAVVDAVKAFLSSELAHSAWPSRMEGITVGFDDGDLIRIK